MLNFLDELAHNFGTDKRSGYHNYVQHYERFFGSLRLQARKIVEIGTQTGASLKMWASYFPNATIYGIDNDPKSYQSDHPRIKTFIADQTDAGFAQQFIREEGPEFDIVIDDGGHWAEQQVGSFYLFLPALKPGGIYVIEDLHCSYWGYLGGGHKVPGTGIEMIKDIIDEINLNGQSDMGDMAQVMKINPQFPFTEVQRRVHGIFIAKSIAFFFMNQSFSV